MCEADDVVVYGLADLFRGQQLSWQKVFLIANTLAFRKLRGNHDLIQTKDQTARLRDHPPSTVPTTLILDEISSAFDSGYFVDGVVDFNLEAAFMQLLLHDITYTFFLDLQDFDEARIKKEVKFRFRVVNPEGKTCVLGNVQLRFP